MWMLGYYLMDGSFNVKAHGSENEMRDLLKKQKPLKKHFWEVRLIN